MHGVALMVFCSVDIALPALVWDEERREANVLLEGS